MAKASRPGNQAVAGITGTSTTSPTYYKSEAAGSAAGSTGKSSSSGAGSSSNKSSKSTSVKKSYSSSTKSSNGNTGSGMLPGEVEIPYSDKFYAALASGLPNGINASEFIARDKATDAARGIVAGAKANIRPGNVAPID